jgi:signal transduction histidine kinase
MERALRASELHYNKSLRQSRRLQEQLRDLSHQLLIVQEEERKRISRELHDEIIQTLTGITLRLANLKTAAEGDARVASEVSSAQRLVEKSVDVVHRFARDLRPRMLDDLGLVPAMHTFMKELAKPAGLRIDFTACTSLEDLPSAKRSVLYRVAQEALTNVTRHAQARRVKVTLQRLCDAIRMEISDDGKGFVLERIWSSSPARRLGLLGMRERVQMVGGQFSIESAPRQGTIIRAEIPTGDERAHQSLSPRPSGQKDPG